jgi:hypothetical protein
MFRNLLSSPNITIERGKRMNNPDSKIPNYPEVQIDAALASKQEVEEQLEEDRVKAAARANQRELEK